MDNLVLEDLMPPILLRQALETCPLTTTPVKHTTLVMVQQHLQSSLQPLVLLPLLLMLDTWVKMETIILIITLITHITRDWMRIHLFLLNNNLVSQASLRPPSPTGPQPPLLVSMLLSTLLLLLRISVLRVQEPVSLRRDRDLLRRYLQGLLHQEEGQLLHQQQISPHLPLPMKTIPHQERVGLEDNLKSIPGWGRFMLDRASLRRVSKHPFLIPFSLYFLSMYFACLLYFPCFSSLCTSCLASSFIFVVASSPPASPVTSSSESLFHSISFIPASLPSSSLLSSVRDLSSSFFL